MTSTAIAKADAQYTVVKQLIDQQTNAIATALPANMDAVRFARVVLTEVRRTPTLLECDPMTLLGAVMLSSQLGLEPGPLGHSWLIPRWNGKTKQKEVQFQIGAEGLRELAMRSPDVLYVQAGIVWQGDTFTVTEGTGGTKWSLTRSDDAPGEWTHVYAVAHLTGGVEVFDYMPKSHVIAHRDRYIPDWEKSKAWRENEPEMGRKTVLARLCRQLPKSIDVRHQMQADGAVVAQLAPNLVGTFDESPMALVDEDPEETTEEVGA